MNEGGKPQFANERLLHHEQAIERIVDFSNGVMGFAITLLVIDIRVPEVRALAPELARELMGLWPQFLAYIISFYVIGENWIIYNRIFSHIERVDERLYWLNLLYLFFVAVLPFPTSLVSTYPDRKIAVLLYAGVIICVGFSRTLIWWYSTRNGRLVHERLDTQFVRDTLLFNVYVLLGFFASAVLGFFSPVEAEVLWVIIIAAAIVMRLRIYRRS